MDKKQISGVLLSLSSCMLSKFRMTPSAYCRQNNQSEMRGVILVKSSGCEILELANQVLADLLSYVPLEPFRVNK